jgi:hypothetical protein
MGPRNGLDDMKEKTFLIPPRLELRSLGIPACIQLPYGLLYPALLRPEHSFEQSVFCCEKSLKTEVILIRIMEYSAWTGVPKKQHYSSAAQKVC